MRLRSSSMTPGLRGNSTAAILYVVFFFFFFCNLMMFAKGEAKCSLWAASILFP